MFHCSLFQLSSLSSIYHHKKHFHQSRGHSCLIISRNIFRTCWDILNLSVWALMYASIFMEHTVSITHWNHMEWINVSCPWRVYLESGPQLGDWSWFNPSLPLDLILFSLWLMFSIKYPVSLGNATIQIHVMLWSFSHTDAPNIFLQLPLYNHAIYSPHTIYIVAEYASGQEQLSWFVLLIQ